MKTRIQTDVTILISLIIITAVVYVYSPQFYQYSRTADNVLDFFGLIFILKGNLLRMWARGHKKRYSDNSERLVVTGPYMLTRNPMYLGTFLMGVGFVLVAWPWWILPFFALFFYWRFMKQIFIEEKMLNTLFPQEYQQYCVKTPRIFPSFKAIMKVDFKNIFSPDEVFTTKEKIGLMSWPVLAMILDYIQEIFVFGNTDFSQTALVFISAYAIFIIALAVLIKRN